MNQAFTKFIAVILCFVLLCSFAACNSQQKPQNNSETGFVAPKDYKTVVEVSINPTVKLYLDGDGKVMAVEYVNKDAEKTYKVIEEELIGTAVGECVTTIVDKAAESGFFEQNKKVTINILSSPDAEVEDKVIKDAVKAAKAVINDKKLNAEVKIKKNGKDIPAEEDKNNESNVDNVCKHSFKDATCTTPKTCTLCGEINGTAVGHKFIEDTCSACGEKDPTFKALDTGVWRAQTVVKEVLYTVYANFKTEADGPFFSVRFGADVNKLEEEFRNDLLENYRDSLTLIDGIYYYSGSGDGDTFTYTENKNSVVMTAPDEYFIIKAERISGNQLKIIEGEDLLIPSGIILTWCEK